MGPYCRSCFSPSLNSHPMNSWFLIMKKKKKRYSNPCSMTFEPKGNTCTLLLVGVACAFGMVSHVQQKMKKHTLKEFQEVSKVWNTSPNTRIWSFLKTVNLASLAAALLYPSIFPQTSRGSGSILALCLCFCSHQSPSSFFLALITVFAILTMRPLALLQC